MIEDEEKAEAARKAKEKYNAEGQLHDQHRRGQWFSNPESGVKQLAAPDADSKAAPALQGALAAPATTKAKQKIESSEFDAW